MAREVAYLREYQGRMDSQRAELRKKGLGYGAEDASCQEDDPGPSQRTDQFRSQAGKQALLGLETFWQYERRPLLSPHSRPALSGLKSEMRGLPTAGPGTV